VGYGRVVAAVNWRAVILGLLLSICLIAVFGQLVRAGAPGIGVAYQFIALFVGAFVAGRLAGRAGPLQGVAVAVLFIVGVAAFDTWADYETVRRLGPDALGSMNLGGIVVGDLVALTAGTAGGWLATGRDTPT
jgi:hypothetical protein